MKEVICTSSQASSGFIPVKILIKRASEFVEKLGAIIVKLPRKIAEYKSQMEKQSVP